MYNTQDEILGLMENGFVGSKQDLRKYGIPYKKIGSGSFREAFVIFPKNINERFVIKFPIKHTKRPEDNISHAQVEIKAIRKIESIKKLAFLRRFLPTILYSNFKTGVIAMQYYLKCKDNEAEIVAYTLSMAYEGLYPERSSDFESYNIMKNSFGDYKIVDLGLLEY